MLNHTGTVPLETERLILRRFTMDDIDDMYQNWASDPEVTRYLSWLPHGNRAITQRVIGGWIESYENLESYQWAIMLKTGRKLIGSISIVEISNLHQRCEVGYCMSKAYWNQGIMTEALKGLIRHLFETVGMQRVQAIHHIANPASGKVMQKAGLQYEGRLRKYHMNNQQELVDCEMYGIVRAEA